MRKVLLAGSALVTALIAFAPAAQAELEVNLGGYVSAQAGFFDNDTAGSTNRDFRSKSELRINATGTAENGLEYGARIDLQTSTDNTTNARRSGIFAQGNFGRFEFGDLDGASSRLSVLAPTVGIGQINGSYVNYIPTADRPSGSVVDTGGGLFRPVDSDQSTKVTYYTPQMSGFQAGISYAPEADDGDNGEQVQFSETAGNQENLVEAGIGYRAKYDNGVSTRVGLVYNFSDAKTGSGREDVRTWGLGAQVGYEQFSFGGGYVDNGDSNNTAGTASDDEYAWNVGARYDVGAWGVALNYIREDYDTAGGRGTDTAGGTYDAIVLGGAYKIADGLSAGADFALFDRSRDTGADSDGYVLVLETKAAF